MSSFIKQVTPPPETKEVAKKKEFRVTNFAYQFKTGVSVILADKNGVYTPKNAEEEAFLKHQVSRQLISYE